MVTWQLTIDCDNPRRLVEFWGPVLGYEPQPPPPGHDTWNDYYRSVGVPEDELEADVDSLDRLQDPEGGGPKIWFQIVPESKRVKNRLHLDVYPTNRDRSLPVVERHRIVEARVAELVAAGASVQRRNPDPFDPEADSYHVVLQDPEGNEFCVG